jgi:membrane fusion protein, multidrug efflux system
MNDITRITSPLPAAALREPWWRETGRAVRRSRLASTTLVLLGLAAIAGLGWYLAHRTAATRQYSINVRFRTAATVAVAAVTRQSVPIYLDALGTVTPLATAVVQSQVSGVLTKIYYTEGETVKAGQPLVQIDPRPFAIAVEQARGNLARDQANLANQRVIVHRDRVLLKEDSIAQQQVDTDEATLAQLVATVASDHAALDSARLNLSFSQVTAPITGRVGLRPVDLGNYVTSSEPNGIATITQIEPIDVEFALPAIDVPRLESRIHTGAKLPTTALNQANDGVLAQGEFLTLDNQIDSQTGTIHAKARFSNAGGALFPQQFVNVRLLLDTLENALVVPAAAVREGPQGPYVYVVSNHVAHVRLVKTGPATADEISIASGLNEGEQVVTEGGDRLVDGATVRLPGDIKVTGHHSGKRTRHSA